MSTLSGPAPRRARLSAALALLIGSAAAASCFELPAAGGTARAPGASVNAAVVEIDLPGHRCSGVLVDARTVLTAAHCLEESPAPERIKVWRSSGKDARRSTTVDSWTIDTRFRAKPDDSEIFDIARLSLDLPLDGSIPVADSTKLLEELITTGQSVYALGYPRRRQPDGRRYRALASEELLISALSPNHTEFSAGGILGDTCRGFSGGPVVARVEGEWWVVGITSRGSKDCRTGGQYAIPSASQDWVAAP